MTLTVLQWWVSVTIGLAAVGHFAGRKLSYALTSVLLMLYVTYTAYAAYVLYANGRLGSSLIEGLIELQDGGTALSPTGKLLISSLTPSNWDIVGGIALLVSAVGAFAATITFVIRSTRAGRRPTA